MFKFFQIEMRLRHLKTDDKLIIKEGLSNMTVQELQNACKERGMRAIGLSEVALRRQMQEWLDLSQNAKVPSSLLLLSRTLYFAEAAQPSQQVFNIAENKFRLKLLVGLF
jgi:LETM1 and EF-hand domain-containing protein 1